VCVCVCVCVCVVCGVEWSLQSARSSWCDWGLYLHWTYSSNLDGC